MNVIDKIMCTEQFCPCDGAYKDLYTEISDEDLRKHNRTRSLDYMTQAEKDDYTKHGAFADVVPLYFSDQPGVYT